MAELKQCPFCGGAYMTSDKDKCPNDVFKAWSQRAGEITVNQYGEGGKVFGHVDTLTINYYEVSDNGLHSDPGHGDAEKL